MIIADYIWISKKHYRWKTRVFKDNEIQDVKKTDNWPILNYNAISTGEASNENTELSLTPAFICKDPFRKSANSYIVFCETNLIKETTRKWCINIIDENKDMDPWFCMKQEYYIISKITKRPFGIPIMTEQNNSNEQIHPQYAANGIGNYYCCMGNQYGRQIAETHMQLCLDAKINIKGINASLGPAQWRYKIGICKGVAAGDHLHVSRYILERLAEMNNAVICWHPKPFKDGWNRSACHTNYSNRFMRNGGDNGIGSIYIEKCIRGMMLFHNEIIHTYGDYNKERLTGHDETSKYDTFTWSVGKRNTSVRVSNSVWEMGKGYLEDRRPASNCDPYLVIGHTVYADVYYMPNY